MLMFHWQELCNMLTSICREVDKHGGLFICLLFKSVHKGNVDFEEDRKLAVSANKNESYRWKISKDVEDQTQIVNFCPTYT